MKNHDFWDVAKLEWPSGKIKVILNTEGNPEIVHNYPNPFFLPTP